MDDIARLISRLSPQKQARLAEQLRIAVGGVSPPSSEPIAITGLACRFPGADSPEAYWRLLEKGSDAVRDVPAERWDAKAYYDPDPSAAGKILSRRGGFLDHVDRFDAAFFGISPREANRMDPQHRLLLEVAWEAVEDAGLTLDSLAGRRVGVFVGLQSFDYALMNFRDRADLDMYTHTGTLFSVAAGRISHFLNLRGAAMAVDTSCSSSLVALHLACQSLRAGDSNAAIVGGVHLMLSPLIPVAFSKSGALAPDGRCKTFDARANGIVRSEGCAVVIVKRVSEAIKDKDPILALIRGCAINHDGHSASFTAPNRKAQEEVYRSALANAGISPSSVGFIETHGTGTSLGDPIEIESLKAVYGGAAGVNRKPLLGAVKTNIGHTIPVAGLAGLIKAILCLEREAVPPNLHLNRLNPNISAQDPPFVFPRESMPWRRGPERRFAAVSSFGISGTNAHVILEEAPRVETAPSSPREPETRPHILLLSAKNPDALRALVQAYRALNSADESLSLRDLCYTAGRRRTRHPYRAAFGFRSREDLLARLDAWLKGGSKPLPASGTIAGALRSRVAFVFTGQGPQWWGMGRELLEREPVFRAAVQECDEILRRYSNWSLMTEFSVSESKSRLNDTEVAQPALLALQTGLVALWRSWKVEPDGLVGHSVGEIASALAAGVLTLEEAVQVAYHRGRLMQRATGLGRMASVGLSHQEAENAIQAHSGRLSIAAVNSPRSVVLSGETEALAQASRALEKRGVFVRPLKVNYSFHSRQMEPLRAELMQSLNELRPRPAATPIFSTVTGEAVGSSGAFDAAYWGRNIRQPVMFSAAITRMIEDGYDAFIEIGPHPALGGNISECLKEADKTGLVLPSLRRGEEAAAMLGSFAEFFSSADHARWEGLYPSGLCLKLPSYPWQRERFWSQAEEPAGRPARSGRKKAPGARPESRSGRQAAPAEGKRAIPLESYLSDAVSKLLGIRKPDINPAVPLSELGLDSLMAWQLKYELDSTMNASLPVEELLKGISIAQLAARLQEKLPTRSGKGNPPARRRR